jgi:hypothetical protein
MRHGASGEVDSLEQQQRRSMVVSHDPGGQALELGEVGEWCHVRPGEERGEPGRCAPLRNGGAVGFQPACRPMGPPPYGNPDITRDDCSYLFAPYGPLVH